MVLSDAGTRLTGLEPGGFDKKQNAYESLKKELDDKKKYVVFETGYTSRLYRRLNLSLVKNMVSNHDSGNEHDSESDEDDNGDEAGDHTGLIKENTVMLIDKLWGLLLATKYPINAYKLFFI